MDNFYHQRYVIGVTLLKNESIYVDVNIATKNETGEVNCKCRTYIRKSNKAYFVNTTTIGVVLNTTIV